MQVQPPGSGPVAAAQGIHKSPVLGFKPNVVVFLIDDMTLSAMSIFDEINPYGIDQNYARDPGGDDPANAISQLYCHLPNIKSLANSGVCFTNAYAMPVCSSSRASLLTGTYGVQGHGVGSIVKFDRHSYPAWLEYGDSPTTKPHLLNYLVPQGYKSAMVGKWHLGLFDTDVLQPLVAATGTGWNHVANFGWDSYKAIFRNLNMTPTPAAATDGDYYQYILNQNGVETIYLDPQNLGPTDPVIAAQYTTTIQSQEGLIDANALQEPFFLYMPFNGIHGPFSKPPSNLISTPEYDITPYPGDLFENAQGMMEALDHAIGDVLRNMTPARRMRTYFVVMGDNGEDGAVLRAMGQARNMGGMYDWLVSQSGRFKTNCYERGTKVPLIVSGPGIVGGGRSCDALVHIADLFPTILDLAGANIPTDRSAYSFAPCLYDPNIGLGNHVRQEVFTEIYMPNGQPPAKSLFGAPDWVETHGHIYDVGDVVYLSRGLWVCTSQHGASTTREPEFGSSFWDYTQALQKSQGLILRIDDDLYDQYSLPRGTQGYYKLYVDTRSQVSDLYLLWHLNGNNADWLETTPLDTSPLALCNSAYLIAMSRLDAILATGVH